MSLSYSLNTHSMYCVNELLFIKSIQIFKTLQIFSFGSIHSLSYTVPKVHINYYISNMLSYVQVPLFIIYSPYKLKQVDELVATHNLLRGDLLCALYLKHRHTIISLLKQQGELQLFTHTFKNILPLCFPFQIRFQGIYSQNFPSNRRHSLNHRNHYSEYTLP